MDAISIPVLIIYSIICGILCAYVANEKNREGLSWFFIGLFTGILGLIAIAGTPSKQEIDNLKRESNSSSDANNSEDRCYLCGCKFSFSVQPITAEDGKKLCGACIEKYNKIAGNY